MTITYDTEINKLYYKLNKISRKIIYKLYKCKYSTGAKSILDDSKRSEINLKLKNTKTLRGLTYDNFGTSALISPNLRLDSSSCAGLICACSINIYPKATNQTISKEEAEKVYLEMINACFVQLYKTAKNRMISSISESDYRNNAVKLVREKYKDLYVFYN